jgi:ubiquinone/menaquinone biosynthesis C-methylase UbiE
MSNAIRDRFDSQWDSQFINIENQIANCPAYDIFPIFQKYINKGSKILEAGCGAGRWLFYYHRNGYDIIGIDWSENTVDRIKSIDPSINVVSGDCSKTSFPDSYFDCILSLGTFEHNIEGPMAALNEAYRILKAGGIMICTMPYLSPIRKIINYVKRPIRYLKARCYETRNTSDTYTTLSHLIERTASYACASCYHGANGWEFFEYFFEHNVFNDLLIQSKFDILESNVAFPLDGLIVNLGSLVGSWDYVNGKPQFNLFGRIMRLLPRKMISLHNVAVVRKRDFSIEKRLMTGKC